jgi:hypothetical protein
VPMTPTPRTTRLVLVERDATVLPGGSRVRRFGLARLERLERLERVAQLSRAGAGRPPAAAPDPAR